jgi:hypothetical protein
MVVVLVFVKTFFYLNNKFLINFFQLSLLLLFGEDELFDGTLTRGDDDDGPAANCDGGVPRKIREKKTFFFVPI